MLMLHPRYCCSHQHNAVLLMQQTLPHVLNVNVKLPGRYCYLQLTICHAMFMYVLAMCALTHKTCADETFGNIRHLRTCT